eukprot:2948687-Pleurochrysis_carterae.AAC.2
MRHCRALAQQMRDGASASADDFLAACAKQERASEGEEGGRERPRPRQRERQRGDAWRPRERGVLAVGANKSNTDGRPCCGSQ